MARSKLAPSLPFPPAEGATGPSPAVRALFAAALSPQQAAQHPQLAAGVCSLLGLAVQSHASLADALLFPCKLEKAQKVGGESCTAAFAASPLGLHGWSLLFPCKLEKAQKVGAAKWLEGLRNMSLPVFLSLRSAPALPLQAGKGLEGGCKQGLDPLWHYGSFMRRFCHPPAVQAALKKATNRIQLY